MSLLSAGAAAGRFIWANRESIKKMWDLYSAITDFREAIRGLVGAEGASEKSSKGDFPRRCGEIIIEEIQDSIDRVGLKTVSGHLKRSFRIAGIEKTPNGAVVRVHSTARYASYLNYGSAPSFGRYVPAIGRRVKNGIHPGNRPYLFLQQALPIIAFRIKNEAKDEINKFLRSIR